jgi:hypothetical protein
MQNPETQSGLKKVNSKYTRTPQNTAVKFLKTPFLEKPSQGNSKKPWVDAHSRESCIMQRKPQKSQNTRTRCDATSTNSSAAGDSSTEDSERIGQGEHLEPQDIFTVHGGMRMSLAGIQTQPAA